jgi:hypothetical protein
MRILRTVLTVSICLSWLAQSPTALCVQPRPGIEPRIILERLAASIEPPQNVFQRASWIELEKEQKTAWEEQEIWADNLGRTRLRARWGTFGADGRKIQSDVNSPTYQDVVFDGEKTVDRRYFAGRDRMGISPAAGIAAEGYHIAQIHDGMWPRNRGPGHRRTPFTSPNALAISTLEDCLESGMAVTVRDDPHTDQYVLEYQTPPRGRQERGNRRCVATILAGTRWCVTRFDQFYNHGGPARKAEYTYKIDNHGDVVPTAGFTKGWGISAGGEDVPAWEWRFVVHSFRLNDPLFDEHVFVAALEPDTAVSDLRYNVQYRVGQEKVYDADLTRLAEQARRDGVIPAGSWQIWQIAVIILSVIALVVIAALAWVRPMSSGK